MSVNCPSWLDKNLLTYELVEDIPDYVFDDINLLLSKRNANQPVVSIVIPAYNEELNLLYTIATLAKNETSFSFEIIVVNNNSTDRTQWVLDRLGVRSVFQIKPGCGPARQLGQEVALGKYVLMADADSFYPPGWIERMTKEVSQEGVSCVYGGYSFLANSTYRRVGLWLYERMRNILVLIRHFKRPYLNALGMNMAYVRSLGLQVGFIQNPIRGEDGRMCFDLMQLGRVVRLRERSFYVWTGTRTLDKEGLLLKVFSNRLFFELFRLGQYVTPMKPHDTKTAKNRR